MRGEGATSGSPRDTRQKRTALGARLPQVLDMLDDLPQTYAHGDASPQNLLLPAGEPGTIVVIDWGFGTLLPVGFDLGQLLVGLAHAGQTDPAAIPAIDAEIFPAYLAGLAAEDCKAGPAQGPGRLPGLAGGALSAVRDPVRGARECRARRADGGDVRRTDETHQADARHGRRGYRPVIGSQR